MHKVFSVITVLTFIVLSGCAQKKNKDYVVTFKTSYGDMVAILYDETPKHKENFIKLAKEHYFDSTLFHRVIQNFMIQGGDPNSKKAKPGEHLGNGGPDYTVDAEFVPKYFHEKGALSAARQSDQINPKKASSGSQFYIVQGSVYTPESINDFRFDQNKLMSGIRQLIGKPENKPLLDSLNALYYAGDMQAYQQALFKLAPRVEKETGVKVTKNLSEHRVKAYTTVGGAPHLDDEYTVFGKVIKGLDVIDKIAAQPRDQADRPLEDVRMMVTVEEMSRKKIEKEYGYKYPEQ